MNLWQKKLTKKDKRIKELEKQPKETQKLAAFFKKGIEGIDKIREANKPITHEANNSQNQKVITNKED